MRNRFLIFMGCSLLLALQLPAADSDRLKFYYNIAEGNYLIGDRRGAERGIEQSLRLDPAHAPSLALQAKIHLDHSKPEEALLAVEKALKSQPQELEYQLLKALILSKLDRRGEAIALIERILKETEPSSEHGLVARHLKGLLNMADESWDEAAATFKSSYEADPSTSQAARQLASEAYLEKARRTPDLNQALVAVDQAIELYSDTKGLENLERLEQLKLTRVQLLVQAGRSEVAIQALQQQLGRNPDNLRANILLASLYADNEQWDALEDLIEPIGKNPLLADVALYLEGRVALSKDRVGTARAKFEEALEANAIHATALEHALNFYRSICFHRLGRHTEAERSLQQAVDGGYVPETSLETLHLARMLIRSEKFDTFIPILEKALLRGEPNPEAWAILGRAHIKRKQNALAISALNQSLALNPAQAETLALRGSLLRRIGDLEGALADYDRSHRIAPSSPVVSYERGLVLLQLGRVEEAEPALRIAARTLPDHVTPDLLHASCAYTLEEYEAAAQSLLEYLDPELTGDALKRFNSNLSETASYLHTLLNLHDGIQLPNLPGDLSEAARLFQQYAAGEISRKQVLDHAGRAKSPERARAQIGSTAYWLAQFEKRRSNKSAVEELLRISLEAGSPRNPEWQFARWLKEQNED